MSTIDERLARLRKRLSWEGRDPTPAERAGLVRFEARRKLADAKDQARAERKARQVKKENRTQELWHKRYFMGTGRWCEGASMYIEITPKLERTLRTRAQYERTHTGKGRHIRYGV